MLQDAPFEKVSKSTLTKQARNEPGGKWASIGDFYFGSADNVLSPTFGYFTHKVNTLSDHFKIFINSDARWWYP